MCYVGILMAENIGRANGRPSVKILWTLAKTYVIPGLQPEGPKSLYCSLEISVLSLKLMRISVTLFLHEKDALKFFLNFFLFLYKPSVQTFWKFDL